jgi:WD40 repeat protein
MALRFWDLATKKVVRTIKAADPLTDRFALLFGRHYGPVFSLAFVQGGKALAAGGLDFTIRFWEVSTGRLLRQIQGHEDWIGSLAAPPSGKILASAGTWRQTIRLWDTATGKELCPLMGHQGAVERVAFSADGKTLVTVSGREPVQLWDVLTGKYARHLDLGGPISFEFTHANGKLLAATRNESSLYVWDIDRGRPIRTFEARNAFARAVGLSPDGSTLAVADQYQGLRLLDVGTGKERLLFAGKYNGSEGLALSPDGKLLAVLGARVRLWQAATAKQIRQFPENESVIGRTITFSPDGKLLASGASEDDMVRLWDVATGKVVRQFPGFNLAFSPDGKTVAAADRVIRLWEVASGKERCRLPGHAAGVWTFAFSPDGRLLASGSKDTTALVWDVTALMRQGRLPTVRLSPEQLNSLWHDLAGDDACRAYQAVWKLTAAGEQSVTFLKGKLRPAAAADTRRIARLLGDLDSNRFTIRQKAADTLEQIGDLATPQLLDVLAKGPTAEVRRQVQLLLDKADGPVASLESLRQLRSVEVLEQVGTASARQVVDALGKGAPEARLTQEAKATLDRLARRSDAPR